MSDDETDRSESSGQDAAATESSRDARNSEKRPNRIFLVPYPKFVFMYPTFIVSLLAAVVMTVMGQQTIDPATDTLPVFFTGLFLAVMMANMFVLVFDFPRATSLTLIFIAISGLLGVWMLMVAKPDLIPSIGELINRARPVANGSFFACITLGMFLMYLAIFIKVRFNYWELTSNELLHHHGFLSDLKRYPAPNLRVDKEINDVFEYLLLGAGRLILHPTTEKRAIVLDNVLFVSEKERKITKELSTLKVKIGGDSGDH